MRAILHIGAGKTGTSAIQAALVRHRAALWDAGTHYPPAMDDSDRRAARGEITSGNAVALGRWLNPKARPRPDAAAVLAWVDAAAAAAAGRDLLFSSELMQFAAAGEAAALADRLEARGYAVQVVCYVRHLLDHAVAVYGQHAKQGLAALAGFNPPVRSLSGWLHRYRLPFAQYLAPWVARLGRDAVTVRLYDAERAALVPGFLGPLGVAALPVPAGDLVNRSPTPAELVVFEALAARPDGVALCRALTRLLMNRPSPRAALVVAPRAAPGVVAARLEVAPAAGQVVAPPAGLGVAPPAGLGVAPPAATVVSPADFAAFSAANAAPLAAFDAAWFGGAGALRLRSEAIAIGAVTAPAPDAMLAVFGDALAGMLAARGE